MAQLSMILCDLAGNALPQEWAIESVLAATVMMEELDRFSPHSVTVAASFRRNLALLSGLATVKLIDADVGVIAWGVIDNPQEQITRADEHTITLSLPNITEVLRYSTTGQGWAAGSNSAPLSLQAIVQRIGGLHYGWSASCLDYGSAPFILAFEDATVLGALTETAAATFAHLRQGRDGTGGPARTLELLQNSAAPTLQLISPDGGNADDIVNSNPYARLVDTITRNPADCTKLVNALTPLGGGSGSQQVRLRRLFKILHDPTYEHYGQAAYFPEYDLNYPIPALYNAAAGIWQPARLAKGDSARYEVAARLDGGADGYEYHVVNTASLATYNALYPHEGEFRSQFSDSTFSYTTDATDITSQEQTERALYVAAKAQLQWYGVPQRTVTVTTLGGGRPPRAGNQVTLGYRRIGVDEQGSFAELDESGTYTIVAVQRAYDALGVASDTWTLTNNGKQPPDAASRASDTTRKLIEAVRSVPTTVAAPYQIASGVWDIDAIHPLTNYWEIPGQAFRVQSARVRINLFPSRANVSVTDAPPLNVSVPIPPLTVNGFALPQHQHSSPIPLHAHGGIHSTLGTTGSTDIGHGQGTSVPASKSGTSNNGNTVPGADHYHSWVISQGGNPGTGDSSGLVYIPGGAYGMQAVGKQIQITTSSMQNYNQGESNHGHSDTIGVGGGGNVHDLSATGRGLGSGATPIGFDTSGFSTTTAVFADNGGSFSGVTTQATTSGTTATHSHILLPGIFETSLPMRVGLYIDSGNGVFVDRSPELGGPWTATMAASVDISRFLGTTRAGQTVRFQVVALTGAGNPTGLGRAELTGVGVLEMSSATATFFAI